jgi:hypothetical protein
MMTEKEGKVTDKNNKKIGDSFKHLKDSAIKWVTAYKNEIVGGLLIAAAVATAIGTIAWAKN